MSQSRRGTDPRKRGRRFSCTHQLSTHPPLPVGLLNLLSLGFLPTVFEPMLLTALAFALHTWHLATQPLSTRQQTTSVNLLRQRSVVMVSLT